MTFKQKVEEILSDAMGVATNCKYPVCPETGSCEDCALDRILAAYKEAVEGMPEIGDNYNNYMFPAGAVEAYREACKEHLLKEGK